jgi:hypothetical protein
MNRICSSGKKYEFYVRDAKGTKIIFSCPDLGIVFTYILLESGHNIQAGVYVPPTRYFPSRNMQEQAKIFAKEYFEKHPPQKQMC